MIPGLYSPTFIPRDYDLFFGLDVDKASLSATLFDQERFVRSFRLPHRAEDLLHYVHNHFPGQRVAFAYEAGGTGFGLYDALTAQGHRCLVACPSMIPKAPGQRVKTNRLDSRQIAEALRGGQLKSIHVPSMPYRHLRHLVQLRDTYVGQTTGFKSRIKALLLYEGIPFPEVPGSPWTRRVLARLDVLPCAPAVRFKLDRLLSSLRFAQEQTRQTVKEIRRFSQNDPEISRCMAYVTSIPGLGAIVASHLLARVGDWRPLHNVRQLAGFLGLGPSEYSTGEHVFRSRITRVGDARLRGKLIQGAWIAIRKDPEMKDFYERIYQRHPQHLAPKKAIVAVARKLTTRIYAVLKEQRLYRKPPVRSHPKETVCPRERLVPSAEPRSVS